jgi:hypothetical protein
MNADGSYAAKFAQWYDALLEKEYQKKLDRGGSNHLGFSFADTDAPFSTPFEAKTRELFIGLPYGCLAKLRTPVVGAGKFVDYVRNVLK